MTTTVLQNARIIDPSRDLDEVGTIVIRAGKVLAAGRDALNQGVPEAAIVRDCRNLVAVPGLVDARVFTGEPGGERALRQRHHIGPAGRRLEGGGRGDRTLAEGELERERLLGRALVQGQGEERLAPEAEGGEARDVARA